MNTPENQMDAINFVMQVETDGFDPDNDADVKALQHLIDTGIAFSLQGSWQRFTQRMIDLGVVKLREAGRQ